MPAGSDAKKKLRVACIIGTRPEAIKLMPVVRALRSHPDCYSTITITTGQHTDLLAPLLDTLDLQPDVAIDPVGTAVSLDTQLGELMTRIGAVFDAHKPDVVVVQGDTASALAGALAAQHRKLKIAHVEAGLRSGDRMSPFPEEMNRRLISRLAHLHLAATENNARTLESEGIDRARIVVTGNPVVDALEAVRTNYAPSAKLTDLLDELSGYKLIALTTHRRESFGQRMRGYLRELSGFANRHDDAAIVFPVHPNPNVRAALDGLLEEGPRIRLIEPLVYVDFLHLLSRSWLIVSDSGGVQEEAPSLHVPALILRENTERPEAVAAGAAKLVGPQASRLRKLLEEAYGGAAWLADAKSVQNPFGDGEAAGRIVDAIGVAFGVKDTGLIGLEAAL